MIVDDLPPTSTKLPETGLPEIKLPRRQNEEAGNSYTAVRRSGDLEEEGFPAKNEGGKGEDKDEKTRERTKESGSQGHDPDLKEIKRNADGSICEDCN